MHQERMNHLFVLGLEWINTQLSEVETSTYIFAPWFRTKAASNSPFRVPLEGPPENVGDPEGRIQAMDGEILPSGRMNHSEQTSG